MMILELFQGRPSRRPPWSEPVPLHPLQHQSESRSHSASPDGNIIILPFKKQHFTAKLTCSASSFGQS